jgi:hypothetical protein
VNQHNFGLEERALLIQADEFETIAAFGDEVEASVGILFDHGHDFSGASHLGEAFLESAHHPEGFVLREAFGNHFFVTRLEDVQGQRDAGKQDNIERE